jgi:ABC-type uncharacterized transport system ATPase subunit
LNRAVIAALCLRGRHAPVKFRSPIDAMAAGMGMVHQSFKLFALRS